MGFEILVVFELIALWAICGAWLKGRDWAALQRWQSEWEEVLRTFELHPSKPPLRPRPAPLEDADVHVQVQPGRELRDTSVVASIRHPEFDADASLRAHAAVASVKARLYPDAHWTGDDAFDDAFVVRGRVRPALALQLSQPARERLLDNVADLRIDLRAGRLTLTSSPTLPGTGHRRAIDALTHACQELAAWCRSPDHWQALVTVALADNAPAVRRLARDVLATDLPGAPDWTRELPDARVDRHTLLDRLVQRGQLDPHACGFLAAFSGLDADLRGRAAARAHGTSASSPPLHHATP